MQEDVFYGVVFKYSMSQYIESIENQINPQMKCVRNWDVKWHKS